MKIINCHLKGSTFCGGQDRLKRIVSNGRRIKPENLILVRDYDCDKDPNCVQVRYRSGCSGLSAKIGNINKENAPLIASCMDAGGKVEVVSVNLCGSIETNIGLYFTVNTSNQR